MNVLQIFFNFFFIKKPIWSTQKLNVSINTHLEHPIKSEHLFRTTISYFWKFNGCFKRKKGGAPKKWMRCPGDTFFLNSYSFIKKRRHNLFTTFTFSQPSGFCVKVDWREIWKFFFKNLPPCSQKRGENSEKKLLKTLL